MTSDARRRAIPTTGSALALTRHHGCLSFIKKWGFPGIGAKMRISNWFSCCKGLTELSTNQDCEEFSPSERSHVEGGIEECMQLCQVRLKHFIDTRLSLSFE